MTDTYGFAPTEKMLAPTTLAEMLDISERHLADVRREDETFPSPKMLGTLPRWSPAVIRRWMEGTPAADSPAAPGSAARSSSKGKNKGKAVQRVH